MKNLSEELYFTNGFSSFRQNGKVGLVNTKGKIILEPLYYEVGTFSDGLCAFFVEDELSDDYHKIGYVDANGNIVITPKSGDFGLFSGDSFDYDFHEGFALYRIQDNKYNQFYGFLNKKGEVAIKTVYTYALPFKEGLAPVCHSGKCGFINTNGETVIPMKYSEVWNFSEGLAAVYDGKHWGYINKQGYYVLPSKYGTIDEHEGIGYVNHFKNGIVAVYLGTGSYMADMEVVAPSEMQKNKFAFIDKSGKILEVYDYIDDCKTYYKAFKGNRQYILDLDRNLIKELSADEYYNG